ncbi:MAG: hypothetical protein HYV34_01340 [Candidatus Kerfeldbacteria bacterium]|nr:hypothetical protein [Candidatus Kerfeldbacteria bacterium]
MPKRIMDMLPPILVASFVLISGLLVIANPTTSTAGPILGYPDPQIEIGTKLGDGVPETPVDCEQLELFPLGTPGHGDVTEFRPFQRVGVPTLDDRYWWASNEPNEPTASPLIGY